MKKFYFLAVMILLTATTLAFGQLGEIIYHDNGLIVDGELINISYTKSNVLAENWLSSVVADMRKKMGTADWYMITYSGANISLIHQVDQGSYESYDIMPGSLKNIKAITYNNLWLISLRLIEIKVGSKQSIIVSDSGMALDSMSLRLKLISRQGELAKFHK